VDLAENQKLKIMASPTLDRARTRHRNGDNELK